MRALLLLFDRTAVLFLGVAAGVAMGYAFGVRQQVEAPAAVMPADGVAAQPGQPGAVPANQPATHAAPGAIAGPPVEAETRPIQAGIVNAIRDGRPVRVGVFGDSFGDGIWSALYSQLSRRSGYQVVKFSQQATGFTRYKTLNLEEHDRNRLALAPVDIAVISFGANDMMGVADGGHVYALLTPNWKAAIARRVSAYVAMLRAQGAIVYWVGLPKMREAGYDGDAARMNAFYRDLMAKLGVAYIDTAPYSVDADGRYTAYLPDPVSGQPTLMRANDGIHMSFKGYVRITSGLASRIRSYVDQARGQAGGNAPPPPLVAPAPPEITAPPRPVRAPRIDIAPAASLDNGVALPADEIPPPPARGAPVDLLPPEMRGGATPPDRGN